MKILTPTIKSREVKLSDWWVVLRDSTRIKWAMMVPFPGKYPYASSISHCQIEPNDPLRFFVVDKQGNNIPLKDFFGGIRYWFFGWKRLFRARTIINPVILETGTTKITSKEGCMSFPEDKMRPLQRFERVTVSFLTFFGHRTVDLYLYRACLLQHELDHFNCVTIYERWKKGRELD